MTRVVIPTLLLTILFALAVVLPFQGTRPLWSTDEGRYSAVALEMLDSGDWLIPHRNPDFPHYSKPPLTYWALAASMAVLGKNVWALRLPSALAFVLTLACVFAMSKRFIPERPWWPSLVCAGTFMIFIAANAISTDPLLCAFETLGMTGFVLSWRGESEGIARRGAWILGAGFGLAFLTKGPPGLITLIPALWFWWRNRRNFRANPFQWTTLAIGSLIALPWFVAVIARDPKLLNYFLGYETYGRIFTDQANRHPQWYGWIIAYGPVALIGVLPWSLVLVWDALRQRGRVHLRADDADDRSAREFLLLWMVLPLIVFVFSRSRLTLYVLPLLVPFGMWAAQRLRDVQFTRTGQILLAGWLVLLFAFKALLPSLYALDLEITHRAAFAKDASVLSTSIKAQVHDTIREVVFVGETALYGVRFYLGTPVLHVDYGDSNSPDIDMSLTQALAQHRQDRLWLVNMHTANQFINAVAHSGSQARQVFSYGYYRGFVTGAMATATAQESFEQNPVKRNLAAPARVEQLIPGPLKDR